MRSNDSEKVPGVLRKEAQDFGVKLERVILIYFQNKYTRKKYGTNVHFVTIPSINPKTPFRFAASILLSYFISFPVLLYISSKYRINLIRADDPVITGIPSVVTCKLLRIKAIVCMYGNIEEVVRYKIGIESKFNRMVVPIVNSLQKTSLRLSHGCIVMNEKLVKIAHKYGAREVFQTFPNIDLSIFQPKNSGLDATRKLRVVFVGRLEREKGPLNVIKVAERLRDVEFIVAGYGSQTLLMEHMIEEKNLSNVKMLGVVSHTEIRKVYQDADILLLPSYSEGMPIVMLEAMASELPVIVSDVGAVGEVLGNNNGGFAVPVGDIDAIVSKINIFIKNRNLVLTLGKKGRASVLTKFTGFIDNQIQIYEKILGLGK
jgi:glycosyltransferase involved in cell wall biosynthesis